MRRKATRCFAAGILALAGCGGGGSVDQTQVQASQLEANITRQLPAEARRAGAGSVYVQRVDCVGGDAGKYSCLAKVRGDNGFGRLVTQTVSISGSCDQTSCIWQSK